MNMSMYSRDNKHFESLVKSHIDSLYTFALYLSGNEAEAEDVVQETFVRVWKKFDRFDTKKAFKPWLFTIARNIFFDMRKKKSAVAISTFDTEEGNVILDTTADEAIDAAELFDNKLAKQDLEKHLASLAPIYRTVINLHIIEELTFKEISEILGESIDTVKSRFRRACTKLKVLLV
jgi:RNA polymerase sigma factor (sigma-70 family)